jgi:hypothetical protein
MTTVDMQQRRLELIAGGREATAMMGVLRPYIDHRVQLLIHKMAGMYRSNTCEFPNLIGIAAQITCLMDMLSDLDSRARQGDQAMREELQGE